MNRDVIAKLRREEEADELFTWLKETSFVNERTDGWAYHDVVKTQMLRHKRLSSPQGWADIHGKLAEYYDSLRNDLQLEEEEKQRDPSWQSHTLNVLYHNLCQSPQRNLSVALNEFLAALKNQRKFAQQYAETMLQAGKDADSAEVQRWGEQLANGLKAYEENLYIELNPKYDWAIARRGQTYRLMKRYPEALEDFDRAIELNPKLDSAIAHRGQTYLMLKLYNEALVDFNRAIDLHSDSNWYLYNRALAYQALNQPDKAWADLAVAINVAKQHYEKDAEDWSNTFNLALYYLAAQYIQPAERLYRYALSKGASSESVRKTIQDLDDFLTVFPDHVQATSIRQLLQSSLT